MSNAKIISLIDAENRAQTADLSSAIVHVDDEVQSLRRDFATEINSLRNRVRDLTLRVTVLEGGTP